MAGRPSAVRRPLLAAALFVAATAVAAVLAEEFARPLSSALAYVLGVTLIGAVGGLRLGLLCAVTASLIYNFFISEPTFRFAIASADELVPLLAFNLCALTSGLLAGRLNDRAREAEAARRRLGALFEVSERLQAAADPAAISLAVAEYADAVLEASHELYTLRSSHGLTPVTTTAFADLAAELHGSDEPALRRGAALALRLATADEHVGVLVLQSAAALEAPERRPELDAFVNLVSIALGRCLLLERVSEAELVKRSEELKTTLLSSVSHDMRTPLAAISASASSLLSFWEDLDPPVRTDLLRTIGEQGDRLNRYTEKLLGLARLQGGLDVEQFSVVDAAEALGAVLARVRQASPEHEFRKELGPGPLLVRADPVMLEQVFHNVLENAALYSPARSAVSVRAAAEGGAAVICVRDEGPGIPPADLQRVFERFTRSASSAGREGSGLGLSIAKGFVEAFGGGIVARSPLGTQGGTEVAISLPIAKDGEK